MRLTIFITLLFLVQNLSGQFGIINDGEGFVNVRKSPEFSNNVIDNLKDRQLIYC